METLLETQKVVGKRSAPKFIPQLERIDTRPWKNMLNFSGTDDLSMNEITKIVDEVRQEMYEHAEQYL